MSSFFYEISFVSKVISYPICGLSVVWVKKRVLCSVDILAKGLTALFLDRLVHSAIDYNFRLLLKVFVKLYALNADK